MFTNKKKFDHALNFENRECGPNDQKLSYHFASNTQKIYSPFQQSYYLPPHLDSSKINQALKNRMCRTLNFEDKKQQINKQTIKMYGQAGNYDYQYQTYQNKLERMGKKKYNCVSRIKYLIEQDRPKQFKKIQFAQPEDQQSSDKQNFINS